MTKRRRTTTDSGNSGKRGDSYHPRKEQREEAQKLIDAIAAAAKAELGTLSKSPDLPEE